MRIMLSFEYGDAITRFPLYIPIMNHYAGEEEKKMKMTELH